MGFGRDSWQYYVEFKSLSTKASIHFNTDTTLTTFERTPVSRSIIQSVAISSCNVGTRSRYCKGELSRARHHCRLQVRDHLTIVQGVGVRKFRWAEAYLMVSCRQQRAIDLQRMQFVKATVDTVA